MDAVVAVSTSPAFDIVMCGPTPRPGRPSRLVAVLDTAGGKAAHAARIAALLGAPSVLVAPLGGPAGESYRRAARAEGIELHAIQVAAPTRRTWAHVDPARGDRMELHEPPSVLTPDEVEDLVAATRAALHATAARVLVVAGSLPPGADIDLHARLVAIGRAHGAFCILDTSTPEALHTALAERPDLSKPNRDEAAALLGETLDRADPARIANAGERVRELGAVAALISLGADGAVLVRDGRAVHITAATSPRHVNAIGCGDAILGGVAAGIAGGASIDDAALLGIAAATEKLGHLHPAEIDAPTSRRLATQLRVVPIAP